MNYWDRIKKSNLTPYFISVLFFLLFWFFRSAVFDGGSSDLWVREIEDGIWFRKRRFLAYFFLQLVHQISKGLAHWDGRLAINLASCLAGAIFVFVLYKICYQWQKGWVPFLLVITSGMTVLFYGHIETYPQSVAATAVFFYILLKYIQGKSTAIYPAVAYSIAVMFHLQLGFLFPIIPFIWYLQGAKKEDLIGFVKGLSVLIFFLIAINSFNVGEGDVWQNLQFVLPIFGTIGAKNGIDPTYTFFSIQHFKDWVWFQYRIAVFSIPTIIILISLKKVDWNDKIVQTLSFGSLCLIVYTLISYPFNGPRTWDTLAIVGLPTTLLAGYLLAKIRNTTYISTMLIVISLLISVAWIIPRAKLGQRGEGTLLIKNVPENAVILLDGYFKQPNIYHVLQGKHTLKIINPPDKFEQELEIIPKRTIVIQYSQSTHN